ncbi:hypothetical protein HBB16_10875 [Pseudonocardia sp. MCCB 268]|nr:hypothetical protein [Pseudonocardia cytotoxica]
MREHGGTAYALEGHRPRRPGRRRHRRPVPRRARQRVRRVRGTGRGPPLKPELEKETARDNFSRFAELEENEQGLDRLAAWIHQDPRALTSSGTTAQGGRGAPRPLPPGSRPFTAGVYQAEGVAPDTSAVRRMNAHAAAADAVAEQYGTDPAAGLSSAEATDRLVRPGPNRQVEPRRGDVPAH